jgi:hypothetical protein
MSLRKIAALLAAGGLAVGLLGSGVGASFFDQVQAIQDVQVGTFGCEVSSTTSGASLGNYVNGHPHSVSITTDIQSSTGSAPFDFTVTSIGSIPVAISVVQPALSGPWSSLLTDPGTKFLTSLGDSYTYNAGLAWAGLTNSDLGTTGSATWTVNCDEYQTVTGRALTYGSTGWGGLSCPVGTKIVSASVVGVPAFPYTQALAKTGVSIDGYTYPVYTHYTYTPPEEGSVVHNGPTGQTIQIVNVCTLP